LAADAVSLGLTTCFFIYYLTGTVCGNGYFFYSTFLGASIFLGLISANFGFIIWGTAFLSFFTCGFVACFFAYVAGFLSKICDSGCFWTKEFAASLAIVIAAASLELAGCYTLASSST